jgi:hypothetical protein
MLALDTSSFLPPDIAHAIAGYPTWLVIVAAVVAIGVALWVLSKLFKWMLYAVLIILAVGCAGILIWMVLSAFHLLPGQSSGP